MSRLKEKKTEEDSASKRYYGRSAICLLVSTALNLAVLGLVFYYVPLFYETNDDYGISDMIAKGYPEIGFVNYYFCKILAGIQSYVGETNVFVVSQIIMSFIAMTVFLKVVIERRKSFGEVMVTLAAIGILAFDHYSSIQFTKTAGLLMASGLVLLADTYIHERRPFSFAAATCIYYIGTFYRQKGMTPAIAYIGIFMILWWILNREEFKCKFKDWRRELVLIMGIIVLIVVPFGLDYMSDRANESTDEMKRAREYSAERVKITDYPVMDNYEENKAKFDEIDISENDLHLINRWILDYDGAASYENLKKINRINADTKVAKPSLRRTAGKMKRRIMDDMKVRSLSGIHIFIMMLLSFYLALSNKSKNWIYIFAIAILTIVCYLAIIYMGRAQYRAFYIADVSAIFWLIYAALQGKKWEFRGERIVREVSAILVTVAVASFIGAAVNELNKKADYIEKKIEPEELADYFDSHQDSMFIGASTIMRPDKSYLDPTHLPDPEINVADTGGWETLSSYKLDQLKKYNITNPVRDIVDKENVYYYSDYYREDLTEYLNKWYGNKNGTIIFLPVDEVAGETVYKVVAK